MLSDWLVPPHFRYAYKLARGDEPRARRMHFLRGIVAWTVPPALQSAILGQYYLSKGIDVSENAVLRNRYAGRQRCFVIGNGPSLKRVDLRPLAAEVTIGCNSFYKHPQAREVGLKYLCCADPSFFDDQSKSIEWHRTIEKEMPHTELLFHPLAKPLAQKYDLYRRHRVHCFQPGVSVSHQDLVQFDLTRPLNVGSCTGTRLAIPLAVYLGFREIYLIGFDCNWLEGYRTSYHFYDKHELWPEFDSQAADTRWPRYEDQLVNALRDFKSHDLIAKRCAQLGISIRNASSEGLLDTYPRTSYEALFGRVAGEAHV